MKQIGEKIVSGVIWSSAEVWGRDATNLIVFVILAQILGPEAIGVTALAMAAPLILAIPVEQGLPDAIIQRREIEDVHLHSAFWLLLLVGTTLTGLLWLGSGVIASALGEPMLEEIARWTSLVVMIKAFGAIPGAVLRRHLQFRLFTLRTMIGIVVGGIAGIAMAISGFGVWSLVVMGLVGPCLESMFTFWVSQWRPRMQFSLAKCRELFSYAVPIALQSFVRIVNNEIPKVVLGAFVSPTASGIYVLALKPLNLLTNLIIGPLVRITMPAVSRLDGDVALIGRYFEISVRLASLVGFPAFAGFAAITPIMVSKFLGDDWLPAITAIQILMLLGFMRCIDGISAKIILALGHSGLILALHMTYTVMASVFFTMAAQFGLTATVVAIVLCNYALLPIFLYKVKVMAGIDVIGSLRTVPAILLSTAIMLIVVEGTQHLFLGMLSSTALISACILAGITSYGIAVVILLRDDLLMVRSLIYRLRSGRGKTDAGE